MYIIIITPVLRDFTVDYMYTFIYLLMYRYLFYYNIFVFVLYSAKRGCGQSAYADQLGTRWPASKSHRRQHEFVFQSRNVHAHQTGTYSVVVRQSVGTVHGATGEIGFRKSLLWLVLTFSMTTICIVHRCVKMKTSWTQCNIKCVVGRVFKI